MKFNEFDFFFIMVKFRIQKEEVGDRKKKEM